MTNPFPSAEGQPPVPAQPFVQPGTGSSVPSGLAHPFLQPTMSANFPKMDQLFGRLVIMMPRQIEVVAVTEKFARVPGETQERVTIDLVVLDGGELNGDSDLPLLFEGMWITQSSLVGSLKGGIRRGQPVLGRVYRFPTKDSASKYPTRHSIEEGFARWIAAGAMGEKPAYTWKLELFTPEELDVAMAWLAQHPGFL